jgi:putative tryptophan/tyrosine transport system substrate-binding protein
MPFSRNTESAFLFRGYALLRFFAALLCLLIPVSGLYAAPVAVTVVLSEDAGAYRDFSNALQDNLPGKDIALTVNKTPADPIPEGSIVIAAGFKAANAAAASRAAAVLNVIISKSGYERLLHEYPQRARTKTFSAIFMDQPMERQIRLVKALLPGRRRLGVIYDNFLPEELAQLRQQAKRHGFVLNEQTVGKDLALYGALQNLSQGSDALLALPDDTIYNSSTIRDILLTTYRNHIPLIGFSPAYVKAGALGSVFSTPAQIARQSLGTIQQYLSGHALPAAQYPQFFELATNEQVANSLNLHIRSESELYQAMSSPTGDEP